MPNWVSNRLTISGPPAEVDRFVTVAGTMTRKTRHMAPPKPAKLSGKRKPVEDNRTHRPEVLSFQHFIPEPRRFGSRYPSGRKYLPKWMRWRLVNWGVKWDACWPKVKRVYRTRVRYWFSTPWDVPLRWLETVSRSYPMILFSLRYYRDEQWVQVAFRAGVFYEVENKTLKRRKLRVDAYCPA